MRKAHKYFEFSADNILYLKIVFVIIFLIFLSLASGNRWLGPGRDYYEYRSFYDGLSLKNWENFRYEKGFILLSLFSKSGLGLEYSSYLSILVAISLIIKFYLIYLYTKSLLWAILVYTLLFYPIHEYTQIRSAVALAFSYLGFHLLFNEKIKLSLVSFIFGLLFQFSIAIMLMVAVTVYIYRRFGLKKLITAVISAAIFIVPIIGLVISMIIDVNPIALSYAQNAGNADTANIYSINNIIYFVIIIIYFLTKWDKSTYPYLFLLLFGLIFSLLTNNIPVFSYRVKEIFAVSSVFLVFQERAISQKTIPALLLTVSGFWTLKSCIEIGIISF